MRQGAKASPVSPIILVTGASGFIGRSLCRTFLARGFRVRAAIRSSNAIASLPRGVSVSIVGDIGPSTDWQEALKEPLHAVVHLAARAHRLRDDAADPEAEFHRVNALGTHRLAEATLGHARRFVFVSSIAAVSSCADDVIDERTPCRPQTPYGRSKLAAERLLHEVADGTSMETVVVRPPAVYGPDNPGRFAQLFRLVAAEYPLPLGGLRNRRSFIYVENLVDALVRAVTHPAAAGETFVVSDGEDVSVSQLVEMVARQMGRRVRLWPAPERLLKLGGRVLRKTTLVDSVIGSLAIDASKFRRMLAWNPPICFEHAMNETTRLLRNVA